MFGPSYQYAATVDRIIDGDTFEATVDLGFRIYHSIYVRLRDFDTPELRGALEEEEQHARAAKEFVKQLLEPGTPVILHTAKAAVYNRWEADVWYLDFNFEQVSLADTLRENGFAKRLSYSSV